MQSNFARILKVELNSIDELCPPLISMGLSISNNNQLPTIHTFTDGLALVTGTNM